MTARIKLRSHQTLILMTMNVDGPLESNHMDLRQLMSEVLNEFFSTNFLQIAKVCKTSLVHTIDRIYETVSNYKHINEVDFYVAVVTSLVAKVIVFSNVWGL